ncbi:MAG: hypothetical protein KGL39_05610 [Patescibacteria group bacterium]|nr:hypothetical protein [Patescibacteria group bacterium]
MMDGDRYWYKPSTYDAAEEMEREIHAKAQTAVLELKADALDDGEHPPLRMPRVWVLYRRGQFVETTRDRAEADRFFFGRASDGAA